MPSGSGRDQGRSTRRTIGLGKRHRNCHASAQSFSCVLVDDSTADQRSHGRRGRRPEAVPESPRRNLGLRVRTRSNAENPGSGATTRTMLVTAKAVDSPEGGPSGIWLGCDQQA